MLTENTLERSNNVCLSACLVFRTFLIFPLGLSWKANPGKQSSVFASPDQSPKNALPLRPFMIQPPLTRVAVEQLQLLGQQQCSFQCSHPRCWFLYRKPRLSKNMVTDNCANCRAITPNYRRFTPNYRAITPRSRDDKTFENYEQLDCHDSRKGAQLVHGEFMLNYAWSMHSPLTFTLVMESNLSIHRICSTTALCHCKNRKSGKRVASGHRNHLAFLPGLLYYSIILINGFLDRIHGWIWVFTMNP